MRRALLVLALVLLVVAGLVVARAALGTDVSDELQHLEVTDASMAARFHPPGSPCVRYAAVLPDDAQLSETAARLRTLGIALDDWGDLFGHLFTVAQQREQALHGRTIAEEYFAELERTTARRPFTRLAIAFQKERVQRELDELTSTRDMAATGAAAFAKLSPSQQEGVLALLAERPLHFHLSAFVRMLQAAREDEERARIVADLAQAVDAGLDEPLACPPLPHRASLTPAEFNAAFDPDGEASLLRQVRLVPAIAEGRFEGFRLFGIRGGTRVAALGFCNGDRVLQINGRPLGSPGEVLDAVSEWRRAKTLDFALLRGGSPGTLTLEVQAAK